MAPPSISIVAPIMVRKDAISRAAYDTGRALHDALGANVLFYTQTNEYEDAFVTLVSSSVDILSHEFYVGSDIIIYHVGVCSPLFDCLMIGAPRARQIVRFHNLTPVELAGDGDRQMLVDGWKQMHLLRRADLVWADSKVNAEVAVDFCVGEDRLKVSPLCVDTPRLEPLAAKARDTLEILFLGRIVPSKGVLDFLNALRKMRNLDGPPFHAHLVGNTAWSSPDYVQQVRQMAAGPDLCDVVTFHGALDDRDLAVRFARAHCFALPSYHEGFCKPVVEALRAGCIPVTYDAYNLAGIAGGNGRTTPTGDIDAFARTLADVLGGLGSGQARTDSGKRSLEEHDRQVARYVAQFDYEAFRHRIAEDVAALVPTR